jgi:hypothetical protein
LIGVCAEFARQGIATVPKMSNPSLRHLASHARIAIHIGKISREWWIWRTARAIKLRARANLR